MFALTIQGGLATSGPPDVCEVPSAGGETVSKPLVNHFQLSWANPSTACQKIFMSGAPACNMATKVPISSGSEAGPGAVSKAVIGPGSFSPASGCKRILLENKAAVPMGAETLHNGDASFNTVGLCPLAAQGKVMVGA